jgi:hypothetical protein
VDSGDLLNRIRTLLVMALLVVTVASVVHGRVFSRWKGRSDVVGNLTRLGGRVAYESEIRINGGEGRLTVLGFDDALDTIHSQIRRILALPAGNPQEGSSSLHILKGDTTTHRLVLLRFEKTGRALAIAIEQTHAEFLKSTKPPRTHLIKAIPPYPGSTPTFFAKDMNTKFCIASSTTTATTPAVLQFYERALSAKGWTASLTDSQGCVTEMPIYHRRSEICLLLVTSGSTPNTQHITLLHKELGNTTK